MSSPRRTTSVRSPGRLKDRIKMWESGEINNDDVFLQRSQSLPDGNFQSQRPSYLGRTTAILGLSGIPEDSPNADQPVKAFTRERIQSSSRPSSIRLSIVFETEENEEKTCVENSDSDTNDSAKEQECTFEQAEASIELAQEALEEVIAALSVRNSLVKANGKTCSEKSEPVVEEGTVVGSLDLTGPSESNGSVPQSPVSIDQPVLSVEQENLESKTTDQPVEEVSQPVQEEDGDQLVKRIKELVVTYVADEPVKDVICDLLDKLVQEKSTVAKPVCVPPPPPPPLPPPPPPLPPPPPPFKTEWKPFITRIKVNKRQDGVDDIELRVKETRLGGEDMMNQLQTLLRKRQNRESLQAKYQALDVTESNPNS